MNKRSVGWTKEMWDLNRKSPTHRCLPRSLSFSVSWISREKTSPLCFLLLSITEQKTSILALHVSDLKSEQNVYPQKPWLWWVCFFGRFNVNCLSFYCSSCLIVHSGRFMFGFILKVLNFKIMCDLFFPLMLDTSQFWIFLVGFVFRIKLYLH